LGRMIGWTFMPKCAGNLLLGSSTSCESSTKRVSTYHLTNRSWHPCTVQKFNGIWFDLCNTRGVFNIVSVCVFIPVTTYVHLNFEANDFKLCLHARQGVDRNVRASWSTPCQSPAFEKRARTLSSQLLGSVLNGENFLFPYPGCA
jgi:hypothetical protein